jgi:hypothetical protein
MSRTITYPDLMALFKRKFADADIDQCRRALQDCYETLRIHERQPGSEEYVRKLWCEIDAIRDRQMACQKVLDKAISPVL